MKFATILREAGICARIFPECGNINVILYDEDDNVNQEENIHFVKSLFADNIDSFNKFFDFINELNEQPPYSTNIQITPTHVVVHYKTKEAIVFRRKPNEFYD